MRVFAYVASVILATALMLGAGLAVALTAPRHEAVGLILLGSFSSSIFVLGPLLVGSLTAYWNVAKSAEGKTAFQRWFTVILSIEGVAAVAFVAYSILAGAPLWMPIVFIGGAAVLMAVAFVVGRALLRYDEARNPDTSVEWMPVTREQIARKIVKVVITFGVALVITAAGTVILSVSVDGSFDARLLVSAFGLAFIAAGLACVLVTIPLTQTLRASIGRDFGLLRTLGKVVMGNKPIELSEADQLAAAKYAAIMSIALPFQLCYLVLLYIGIGFGQVPQFFSKSNSGFALILLVLLAAFLIVFVPYYVIRMRRVQRYARAHPVPATAQGAEA